MRLRTFYVKSYRSIIEAKLDDVNQYTVIVGPNNAGKSNLLRAVFVSLSIALEGDFQKVRRNRQYSYAYSGADYNWMRDIPVSLAMDEKASTTFKLTFEFSPEEKDAFRETFGINLSKSLQMKFQLFFDRTEYNIIMPGKAKKPMEKQIREIGLFIRSKLDYEYIPCVRSTDFTAEYFSRLLNRELRQLETQAEYQKCMHTIKCLQAPILSNLEEKITQSLKAFIPNITQVKLDKDVSYFGFSPRRTTSSRQIPIDINDGNLTSLDDKGDGIKSLAAIGIVQSISFDNAQGRASILCIEEPEAHLHPDAVHSLRNVLIEMASKPNVQVIISTHSPILIDRDCITNNILVTENHRVSECSSVSQIREILGVRIADSLSAKKVIFVEGESDRRYFVKFCIDLSPMLRIKIENGSLEFVNVHSATKMDYQIRLYNSLMISSMVLLDSDASGKETQKQLLCTKTKLPNEILMIKSAGMKLSELEDIISLNAYSSEIQQKFNISLDNTKFRTRKKPWSDRLHEAASTSPGPFDESIEAEIKTVIADIVEREGASAIAECDIEYINNVMKSIENFVR